MVKNTMKLLHSVDINTYKRYFVHMDHYTVVMQGDLQEDFCFGVTSACPRGMHMTLHF